MNTMDCIYCHVKTTPDMPIRMAVRMSACIPGMNVKTHLHTEWGGWGRGVGEGVERGGGGTVGVGMCTAICYRHLTARHGTARHGTARHGTARHGTARLLQTCSGAYFMSKKCSYEYRKM